MITMKLNKLFLATGLALALSGCYDEDKLEPTGNYSVLRSEFPQGNNPWDKEIEAIHEEYGTYLLYKGITMQDLNRTWTSVGTGGLLYAGNQPNEAEADLSDEKVATYVSFLKDHILAYISPEDSKGLLPVKIYMVQDLRLIGDGTDPGPQEDTGELNSYWENQKKYFVPLKTDGFDYWAISLKGEEVELLKQDAGKLGEAARQTRNIILYNIIKLSIMNGTITEPDGFTDGIVYDASRPTYDLRDARRDPSIVNDKDYYLNRGFIDVLGYNFNGLFEEFYGKQTLPTDALIHHMIYGYLGYDEDKNLARYTNLDFVYYIRAAMYYSEEEFEALYPSQKWPLVHKRYKIIVDAFRDKYGIDLQKISAK